MYGNYMIKLIIFDLDGVLVDTKKLHYDCLNLALIVHDQRYFISWEEHVNIYDGLKTEQKLDLLHFKKGLPKELFKEIWEKKQQLTFEKIKDLRESQKLTETIQQLSENYKLACCSNSIRKTVISVLSKLNIIQYFDLILSNDDVKYSKPHPEIYWKCISHFGFFPEEVLIVEDSPCGILAATKSHSNLYRVKSPDEVTMFNILNEINNIKPNITPKWKEEKLNIVIPMAGAGSRFSSAGYTFPKPLIDVNKTPMIQVVVDNINIEANYIFIVQKSHRFQYNLDSMLKLIAPNCKLIEVDGLTEGAACTTLLAKELIDNDDPLLIANSDQFVEWNSNEFMYKMNESKCDAGIVTFKSTHPKWSFVKLDDYGKVIEVAEKNPISDNATAGIYYWKHGKEYVAFAEQMIQKDIRVNNEYYVCPVFNEAIASDKTIISYEIEKMWGLGTPEDLNYYMEHYNI